MASPSYKTVRGAAFCGDSRELIATLPDGGVNLVITSPPFALLRQKDYGNVDQEEYVEWLIEFARLVYPKLRTDGSFVLDLGGSYKRGTPVRSLYNFRVLIRMCDDLGFFLAEDFYWFNPSKLPSPIEWVNKRKVRAKDSVNTVWWFSKSENPKANVSKVLIPYSDRMKKLLSDPQKFYRAKSRPSGHDISEGFGKDNGGAIPSNLLQIPNTEATGSYTQLCKLVGAQVHPARFPQALPSFFIRFLTDPDDLVIDIFAGSNTTGKAAELESRRWITFEERLDYVAASSLRFVPPNLHPDEVNNIYSKLMMGETLDFTRYRGQYDLYDSGAPVDVEENGTSLGF